MKHIRKFNEEIDWMQSLHDASIRTLGLSLGHLTGVLLLLGLMRGYPIVQKFINLVSFNKASKKIEPIFDKIKDDSQMSSLVEELNNLVKKRNDSGDPYYLFEGDKSKLVEKIYKRASELLDEFEFEVFKSATEEFSRGAGEFKTDGTYFYNKDAKFKNSRSNL